MPLNDKDEERLKRAARKGDLETLREALASGIVSRAFAADLACEAAENDHVLLSNYVDDQSIDIDFAFAAGRGDLGALREGLAAGIGDDPKSLGMALIEAIREGQTLAASYLIDHGAEANYKATRIDPNIYHLGWTCAETPLIIASRYGHDDIIRLLLKHSTAKDSDEEESEFTQKALEIASRQGHLSSVAVLINAGISITYYNKHEGIIYSRALSAACQGGHISIINLLIEKNCPIGVIDLSGNLRNQIHAPIVQAAGCDQGAACRALIKAGADPNAGNGMAMILAARQGRREALEALIEGGGDPRLVKDEHCDQEEIRALMRELREKYSSR